ncbi:MAG TPA: hypothetical protein VGB63_02145 [Pedobacter sp.]
MANTLEGIVGKVSSSLGKKPKRISIILQNQGTSANGFVQLAPRRSEFFATPSQSFDYQNWLNSLAVHELRHVVQFDKLTGAFNFPPFESLALAMFGVSLPSWFFEGDAVTTETVLTEAGRGRIPEWYIAYRSNTLSGKNYSYSKNYFGSVKDFTAGYYQLGFFMNTKLRRDFGNNINDSLITRISKNPLRPYNFSNSVKKFTNLNTSKLHKSTVNELKELWSEQLEKIKPREYRSLNKRRNRTPQSLLLPVNTPTGNILYLLDGKAKTQGIYEMTKDGKTRKVLNIGIQEIPWFSYAAPKIVWDELRFDARYQKRSFNVINIYDIRSKSKRQLTHKSRLFAPALSPNGQTIAAVEVSPSQQISLVILSAQTGKKIRRYPSPNNFMLQMPAFNQTGDKIAVIAVATSGKTIFEVDLNTGDFTQLMPLQLQEILRPVYSNGGILFKAHFNGIDNVYTLNHLNKEIVQLTSSMYGANNPSVDTKSGTILFNNYTPEGYDISSIPINTPGTNITSIEKAVLNYADPLIKEEGETTIFENLPSKKYSSKRYRELSNLFYFHSFRPIAEDIPNSDNKLLGFRLQSDNKLNTLSFYTGYQYNQNFRRSEYETGFIYSRFFPILAVSYVNRPDASSVRGSGGRVIPVTYRENEFKADVSVPILLNRFNNIYRFNFKTGVSQTSFYDIESTVPVTFKILKFPVHYEFSASRTSRRSARDLAPKWSQNVSFRYRHFPFENMPKGDILTFNSSFFFPGLATNHSFQASYNFQFNSGIYERNTNIPRVSGHLFMKPSNARNTFLLDYRLPLFYPDWELGPLAYIKRFKAGFFADFENIDSGRKSFAPRSYGAELRADMNLLRFPLPNFDLGGRIIFLNEKSIQNPIFETVAVYNF